MKYAYKGKTYTLMYYGWMKDIQSGEWVMAAVYKNNSGELFIREKQDFLSKFERVA